MADQGRGGDRVRPARGRLLDLRAAAGRGRVRDRHAGLDAGRDRRRPDHVRLPGPGRAAAPAGPVRRIDAGDVRPRRGGRPGRRRCGLECRRRERLVDLRPGQPDRAGLRLDRHARRRTGGAGREAGAWTTRRTRTRRRRNCPRRPKRSHDRAEGRAGDARGRPDGLGRAGFVVHLLQLQRLVELGRGGRAAPARARVPPGLGRRPAGRGTAVVLGAGGDQWAVHPRGDRQRPLAGPQGADRRQPAGLPERVAGRSRPDRRGTVGGDPAAHRIAGGAGRGGRRRRRRTAVPDPRRDARVASRRPDRYAVPGHRRCRHRAAGAVVRRLPGRAVRGAAAADPPGDQAVRGGRVHHRHRAARRLCGRGRAAVRQPGSQVRR